jgi:hypothetical protein
MAPTEGVREVLPDSCSGLLSDHRETRHAAHCMLCVYVSGNRETRHAAH